MKIKNCVYIDSNGEFIYYDGAGVCPFTGNHYHRFIQSQDFGDAFHYGYVSKNEMVEWTFKFPVQLGE